MAARIGRQPLLATPVEIASQPAGFAVLRLQIANARRAGVRDPGGQALLVQSRPLAGSLDGTRDSLGFVEFARGHRAGRAGLEVASAFMAICCAEPRHSDGRCRCGRMFDQVRPPRLRARAHLMCTMRGSTAKAFRPNSTRARGNSRMA